MIVTVGIAGSGKSYWSKEFVKNNPDWRIVSTDVLRKQLTGDVSNQSQNKDVWRIAYAELESYLSENINVIFDSTACNISTIKKFVEIANRFNSKIEFKVFYCDPKLAYKIIESDIEAGIDRSDVPFEVIENQYKNFKEVVKYLKENNYTIRMF